MFHLYFDGIGKRTCRQHCGALNLKNPPVLMRGKAFQKTAKLLAVR